MMNLGGALGTTAELAVILKLKNEMKGPLSEAQAQLSVFNRQTATVGSATKKIGAGLMTGAKVAAAAVLGIGAAATVAGIEVTKGAATFQSDMELIRTQAHASQSEVDTMTQALISMAGEVGTTPDELSAGLYHLESAGFRGAKALDALKIAAEGAKVGHADLEDVTNALDAVLVAGGKDAENMSGSMGELNAIVGAGDMRMQDLADAMGTGILGVAHTFGLTLKDVGAALATFGDNNIRGSDAATKLRQAIVMMGAPSTAAAKALKTIGLSATDLGETMRTKGLVPALEELKTALTNSGLTATQQANVIAKAFGGGRTGAGIMLLLDQLDRLETKEKDVAAGADKFGADWAAQQQTVAQASANMHASFVALETELGLQLLPVATRVLDALTSFFSEPATIAGVKNLGNAIGDLFSQQNIDQALTFANHIIPEMKEFASEVIPPLLSGLRLTASIGKEAFSMFNSLPGPIKTIVIAALAGNKLTGGLVASGIADLGKILIGAFKNAATAEMNVAAGVVNVVGGPGVGGAAAAAAGGGGIAALLPVGLIAAAAAEALREAGDIRQQRAGIQQQTPGLSNVEALALQLSKMTDAQRRQSLQHGAATAFLNANTTYTAALASAIAKEQAHAFYALNAQGKAPVPGALGSQQYIDQAIQAAKAQTDATKAGTAATVHALDAIHLDFQAANAALKKATTPADIVAAAKEVTKDIMGGVGNVKTTKDVLADLKAKELTVTDPATRKVLDQLIGKVQTKLAGREQIASMLNKDEGILKSGNASADQLRTVKSDIRTLKSHGDTHAAAQLEKLEKIREKNMNPTVNVSVSTSISVRDTVRLNQQYVRYGPPVRA